MRGGHFISIEGTDGSGKATQVKLLRTKLQMMHIPTQVIAFPRYGGNPYSRLITQYLNGDFGDAVNVNHFLISLAYAGDRFLAKNEIFQWLKEKQFVIADRYVPSNKAYQSSKLPLDQRQHFIDWLDDLEYNINGIPREELIIFLYVPPKISAEILNKRPGKDHTVATKRDQHETNPQLQKTSSDMYLHLAKEESNWVVIDCLNKENQMRTPKEIHEQIMDILKERKLI